MDQQTRRTLIVACGAFLAVLLPFCAGWVLLQAGTFGLVILILSAVVAGIAAYVEHTT